MSHSLTTMYSIKHWSTNRPVPREMIQPDPLSVRMLPTDAVITAQRRLQLYLTLALGAGRQLQRMLIFHPTVWSPFSTGPARQVDVSKLSLTMVPLMWTQGMAHIRRALS